MPATSSVPPGRERARARALGPSGVAAGPWSGRDLHCDATGRGFLWLGLRDRKTDWRGVAGKGRGFSSLWLLFAVGRSLPGEREDLGSRLLCFLLGHASTPPPLAEPVLGRCHPPAAIAPGRCTPSFPLTRRGALLPAPGRPAEGQARVASSLAFLEAGRVLALLGTLAARPGEPGLPKLWVRSAALPGPARLQVGHRCALVQLLSVLYLCFPFQVGMVAGCAG